MTRLIAVLTFSLVFLFVPGCVDEPTAPELDLTASYAKGSSHPSPMTPRLTPSCSSPSKRASIPLLERSPVG